MTTKASSGPDDEVRSPDWSGRRSPHDVRRFGPRAWLAVVAAATLALAACGGGDGDQAPDGQEAKTGSSTTSTTAAATVTEPGADPGTLDNPISSTTVRVGSRGGGAADAPSPTTGASQATAESPAAAAPVPVETEPRPLAPGTYVYAVSGTAKAGASTFQLPPESKLVVDPPAGDDQRLSRQSDQGSQEQTLHYKPDGTYLLRQSIASPQGNKEFLPDPPVSSFPHPLNAERKWSWEMRSTDSKTTVKADFAVVRTEAVVIGGETVNTVVISSVIVTSGDVASTIRSTVWYSPGHRLTVKTEGNAKGTYNGLAFESNFTETLTSTRPS